MLKDSPVKFAQLVEIAFQQSEYGRNISMSVGEIVQLWFKAFYRKDRLTLEVFPELGNVPPISMLALMNQIREVLPTNSGFDTLPSRRVGTARAGTWVQPFLFFHCELEKSLWLPGIIKPQTFTVNLPI